MILAGILIAGGALIFGIWLGWGVVESDRLYTLDSMIENVEEQAANLRAVQSSAEYQRKLWTTKLDEHERLQRERSQLKIETVRLQRELEALQQQLEVTEIEHMGIEIGLIEPKSTHCGPLGDKVQGSTLHYERPEPSPLFKRGQELFEAMGLL